MRWYAKALTQYGLSKLPGGERINQHLQKLSGLRDDSHFLTRIDWGLGFLEKVTQHQSLRDKRVLEIGPGWDAIQGILLHLVGVREIVAFDHVAHLRPALAKKVANIARQRSADIARIAGQSESIISGKLSAIATVQTLEDLTRTIQMDYRAPGDGTRTGLADNSIDIVYTYSVLANCPEAVVRGIVEESARIMRPGGFSAHHIDLSDPFADINGGNGVNFLRFSDRAWSVLGNNDITCHNRMRASEYLALFTANGLDTTLRELAVTSDNLAHVKDMAVADRFKHFETNDLAATTLDLVAVKPMPA